MKKKILFLLLLLLPFMVKALDIQNLNQKWIYEDESNYSGSYRTENTFIFFNEETIISIDKQTGTQKEIAINPNNFNALIGNNIYVVTPNEMIEGYKINVYDENLNLVKKFMINDMHRKTIEVYKNEYLMIVGYVNGDNENLVARFYDENGNLAKTDSFKTNNELEVYSLPYEDEYPPPIYYFDFNSNTYTINNFKIVPINTNSDGSYMYLTNDHLYKLSSTGEELGSIEIPNGKGTRMAKLGDKYYIATGVYESNSDEEISIGLNLYIVDENLNIIKTGSIPTQEGYIDRKPSENGYDYFTHDIFNDDGTIKIAIHISNDSNHYSYYYGYSIDSNLEATEIEYHLPYGAYSPATNGLNANIGLALHSIKDFIGTSGTYSFPYGLYEHLDIEENSNVENFFPDGDNYLVTLRSYKCEGEGCDDYEGNYLEQEKIELLYLDSNYNELFRKTIYDWHAVEEYKNNSYNRYRYSRIAFDSNDEYIFVLGTGEPGNIYHIYDKQGNLVKDYSEYISKYTDMKATDIKATDKGIYISLEYNDNLSRWLGDKLTLPIDRSFQSSFKPKPQREGPSSIVIYYSNNFNVKKEIKGNGKIASTLEKADVGEVVKFTVTPDPGYVLSVVKVIDANGNALTFTNNTFVMPASDVIIEASFVPVNPNTGDIAILTIVLITIASAAIFIIQKKKIDFLK